MIREKKTDKKRKFILSKSKDIFIQKGFLSVTMKDVIEECGISRGGIYLYFQSVDEIFLNVIAEHTANKLKESRNYLLEEKSFFEVFDEYMQKQKNRLLNINNTLLIAMYEYRFFHKEDYDKEFFKDQFLNTKNIVYEILSYGVNRKEIIGDNIDEIATSIVFFIEGISMLGNATGVSHEIIDSQIEFIKKLLYSNTVK